MKRVVKTNEERRREIVATARRLFIERGFAAVPVSAIVAEIGAAQGTFYYYFPTKEKVLDAIIEDYLQGLTSALDALAADPSLDPRSALERMTRAELGFDAERGRELCSIEGGDAHTRLFSNVISSLAPRYASIIMRGIAEGVFRTPDPDLIAETIILHVHFLFDREVLGWNQAEYKRRLDASARLIDVLLSLPLKSLDFSLSA
jgi:AcrR family transcriptional regulator